MKSILLVGIGDYKLTNDPNHIIKTIALGSCVAVVLFCRNTNTTGMAHIALPSSSINPERAVLLPAYFADTGIPILLKGMKRAGASTNIFAKLAGGAAILDTNNFFNIGNRNISAIKQLLKALNIPIIAENTGGNISRTVSVNISTRSLLISHKKQLWEI